MVGALKERVGIIGIVDETRTATTAVGGSNGAIKEGGQHPHAGEVEKYEDLRQPSPPSPPIPARNFELDGYTTLNDVLGADYIDNVLLPKAMENFQQCFEIMNHRQHTPFREHRVKDAEMPGAEYALGLGARNGFREIVRR